MYLISDGLSGWKRLVLSRHKIEKSCTFLHNLNYFNLIPLLNLNQRPSD